MAIEKHYKCDLCGEYAHKDAIRRLGVRTWSDRPEAAEVIDVGPCCCARPILEILSAAAARDAATVKAEP